MICAEHQEYQVPIISTMAFMGAEYWCPYCGMSCGIFGPGFEIIVSRQELEERHVKYKEASAKYLESVSDGDRIQWSYEVKAEDIPSTRGQG